MGGRRERERITLPCLQPFVHWHLSYATGPREGHFDIRCQNEPSASYYAKKQPKIWQCRKLSLYLQLTQVACKGERVKLLRLKDVYKRFLLRADLANQSCQKIRNRTSTLGVLYPALMGFVNISRRGLSRVVYPEQGNARARTWDEREVENPRLSSND